MNLKQLLEITNSDLIERGLDQIADGRVSGLFTERNVRFFRQAGVISRPEGQGPAASWSSLHKHQLLTARFLQAQGLSLQEVRDRINGFEEADLLAILQTAPESPSPRCEPCSSWNVAPGFILVSTRRKALSSAVLQQIHRLLSEPTIKNL